MLGKKRSALSLEERLRAVRATSDEPCREEIASPTESTWSPEDDFSLPVSEPLAAEPPATERPATEPPAAEFPATEPRAAEPRAAEPRAAEFPAAEPRAAEFPASEPPTAESAAPRPSESIGDWLVAAEPLADTEARPSEAVLDQVSRLLGAASEGDTFLPVDPSDAGATSAPRRAAQTETVAQRLTFKSARITPNPVPLGYENPQLQPEARAVTPSTPQLQVASPFSLGSVARELAFAPPEPARSKPKAETEIPETEIPETEPAVPDAETEAEMAEAEMAEAEMAEAEVLESEVLEAETEVPEVQTPETAVLETETETARSEAPIELPGPRVEPVVSAWMSPELEAARAEAVAAPAESEPPAINDGPGSRRLPRLHGLGRRRAAESERPKVEPVHSEAMVIEAGQVAVDEVPWTLPVDRSGRFGRIGTTMIERGLITNEQLDSALEVQRTTGRRVGEILVGMAAISRFELARVLADHMGVPFVDLRAKPPDPILAALLPEEVARRYRSLVIDRWNGQLVIAMANPADLFALDDLQMVMRQPIITAMAVEEDLIAAIDRVYSVSDVETTLDAATSDYVTTTDDAVSGLVEVDEGPVVRLVNALMEKAIRDHASDLHVEPWSDRVAIRFRVDGVLHDSSDVPLPLMKPLVSRLKIMASLDIAQNRLAQDGRFSMTVEGRPVDVRVVTIPTAAGESVILRLLDASRNALDLSSLGLNATEEARFVPPFFASQGAAFITGPTGSGKTSTVYTLLSEVNSRSKSIISVEDPVEYRLDGIKQIQANPRVGLTFANTLPSILRADPDIVFIGEVRDADTARIAADASITGHLVLSTLHATRAAAAPMRLVEMGVEPYLVASALTLVAAQRLARKLCDRCAESVDRSDLETVRSFGADDSILEGATVRRAVGCPACRNSGYLGRLPIFEILPVTEPISRLILDRAPRAQIERLAVEEGMETMRTAALRRVAAGLLSLEEMMRVIS
jgi:type IV pilus assembly protein PilB